MGAILIALYVVAWILVAKDINHEQTCQYWMTQQELMSSQGITRHKGDTSIDKGLFEVNCGLGKAQYRVSGFCGQF